LSAKYIGNTQPKQSYWLMLNNVVHLLYCLRTDKEFTVHKLYYWFNKIKKEQADTRSGNTGFTRVRPKEVPPAAPGLSSSPCPSLEVNLSNGTRLVFYQAISKDLLNVFL
jgi:hypothetical protein